VAVVGTRRATAYGREACSTLVGDLARSGVTIVSGLALGIDGVSHRVAIEAGGRPIAVLGSGLGIIYPAEHRALAQQVAEAGALVSEHPLGTRPLAQNFPRRNRILSGMARGVLMVEAPEASGAMWTVHWALEEGREVFAVPGSIFSPASQGVNRLLQQGAKLILGYTDVLEELNLPGLGQAPAHQEELPGVPLAAPEGDEAARRALIGHELVHIDEVGRGAGLPMAAVSSSLAVMEIKGLVKQVGTMHYVRTQAAPAII
jgi:DNA processing protein